MTHSTNSREKQILELAEKLLGRLREVEELDEARVDAEFLFRFEVVWCRGVSRIRAMMRNLIGLSGDDPLSDEDAVRWLIHLEANEGLVTGWQSEKGLTIENSQGAYHVFDEDLRERQVAFSKSLSTTTENQAEQQHEFDRVYQEIWAEANQTSKIQSQLEQLARAYHLVPADYELGEYPLNRVKQQYEDVVKWVLWGYAAPSLFYARTKFIENEAEGMKWRSIRPWKWPKHEPFSKRRLPLATRIRTWAIYYLTQRGGGDRDRASAVNLWNIRFPGRRIDPAYYEDNLARLFEWGTGRGFAPSLAASFEGVRKRRALLVGVDEYEDDMFRPLNVCARDVEAISERLVYGGFDRDCTHVITDFSDTPPTRLHILEALKAMADAAAPDDLLFFYFSGHGIEENGEPYLLPKDFRHILTRDTAVSVSRLKEIIVNSSARAKVIVLDACHSGAQIKGKGDKRMSRGFIRRVFEEAEGVAILSSCKQGEVSYELPSQDHSVFTYFLLEALEGSSDRDGKGFVTVQDLNLYVLNSVKQWANENRLTQTPTFQASTVGDIPLVRCR